MKWICALFALALIALVATADAGLAEPMFEIVHRVPLGDKIGHVLLLGTMSLLLNLALRVSRFHWGRFHPLQGTAILLVLATLEEFSQLASTHRTFSFGDAASNAVGIVTFGWLAVLLHRMRTR
ncbi:MAG: hypothetical protein K8T91_11710 [Planctomycetes bacterium]|nr:hypothetical protein [Planctomycetota bacterium]